MGAEAFYRKSSGKSPDEAFGNAVRQAQYDHGHSGYTGTIAEKMEFVEIPLPEGKDPRAFADELIENDDERVADKWGPAGCIKLGPDEYLFFGWASS